MEINSEDSGTPAKPNLDSLLEELGGCGYLQIMSIIVVVICSLPGSTIDYSSSYVYYNPGWHCMDNDTQSTTNNMSLINPQNYRSIIDQHNITPSLMYNHTYEESCTTFQNCHQVKFDPSSSTVVSEFGLLCDKKWIPAVLISVQSIGWLLSNFIVGPISDRFGRKQWLQISMFSQCVLNIVLVFSVSWKMFLAIYFMIGILSTVYSVSITLMTEFVTPKWRVVVSSLPISTLAGLLFSVVAMMTRNWKTIHFVVSCVAGMGFFLLFLIPKSIRWLYIRGKHDQVLQVVKRICKANKVQKPQEQSIFSFMQNNNKRQAHSTGNPISLFQKGYRMKTISIWLSFLLLDVIYYILAIGISVFPGDYYQTVFIFALSDLPSSIISMAIAIRFGRKISTQVLTILSSMCLGSIGLLNMFAPEGVKTTAMLASVMVAKIVLNAAWTVIWTHSLELYPTVVRGTLGSYAQLMTAIGSAISPFLIPDNPDTFSQNFFIMAALPLVCCCFTSYFLPETKDKPLLSTWEDKYETC